MIIKDTTLKREKFARHEPVDSTIGKKYKKVAKLP
jgi:hypothetical protein